MTPTSVPARRLDFALSMVGCEVSHRTDLVATPAKTIDHWPHGRKRRPATRVPHVKEDDRAGSDPIEDVAHDAVGRPRHVGI